MPPTKRGRLAKAKPAAPEEEGSSNPNPDKPCNGDREVTAAPPKKPGKEAAENEAQPKKRGRKRKEPKIEVQSPGEKDMKEDIEQQEQEQGPQKKQGRSNKPQKQGGKAEGGEEEKGGSIAVTFARRYQPKMEPGRTCWDALCKAYRKVVTGKVRAPSTLEELPPLL